MKKVLTIGAAVAVSGTLAYSAEAASHTVDTGDTLWDLAQENNTSVESIKTSNDLSSGIIMPGQVLEIGGEEKAEEKVEEKAETAEEGLYTIKAGDTLFEIAQQFNVTVSDLKAWNNLSSDLIFEGKTITVSGENAEQAPAVEAPQVEEEQEPAQKNEADSQSQQEEQAAAEQQSREAAAEERAAAERAEQQEKQQAKTEKQSTSANSSGQNWGALAQCESGGNSSVVSSNGLYHGLYQFDVQTWKSVGGSGLPSQASAAEQTKRAQILFDQRGSQPWPVCGSRL